ncbi:unnamed protein product, partial [Mycena citricolor]
RKAQSIDPAYQLTGLQLRLEHRVDQAMSLHGGLRDENHANHNGRNRSSPSTQRRLKQFGPRNLRAIRTGT